MRRQSQAATEVAPGKYVDVGDAAIHYQELGPKAAITVLFVGGTGAWSDLWSPR